MIRQVAVLVTVVIAVLGGCIWIDDDGTAIVYPNLEETVIYINRTEWYVDNMIDGEFVGTVAPGSTLRVASLDLDGPHEFYSTARDTGLTWGPTTFTLYDGEEFKIYLEETGMSFAVER